MVGQGGEDLLKQFLFYAPLTMMQRHDIRNKLQLIMSYSETGQPEKVKMQVREIDLILGGKNGAYEVANDRASRGR